MYVDRFGGKYYKVALHLHTTLSDGTKTPEEVAAEYRGRGYDAIALTDHWHFGEEKTLSGLHVISGIEYNVGDGDTSVGEMHILALGARCEPDVQKDGATRLGIVAAIEAAGGIAVLAHPAWSLNNLADLEELPTVAFTEIYNAVSEAHESMRAYSDYFVDAAANSGRYLGLLATDDAHYYDGTDNCRGWVYVKADELTTDSLINALRCGDFYATQAPTVSVRRDGEKFYVESSPASVITAHSNRAWRANRTLRGENLTYFEYEFGPLERWVRFEVLDSRGRRAYTNIYKR